MKRKTALSTIIISVLLVSLVTGLQAFEVAKANFLPVASIDQIWSPENKTYASNLLTLNVSVSFFITKAEERWIAYSLDGGENVTLTGTEYLIDLMWKGINITTALPALSEGSHRLDVYAQFSTSINFSTPHSRTVFFTIDTLTPTSSPSSITSPTPKPTLTSSFSPEPSPSSPSQSSSPSPSPTLAPLASSTQQPTIEPSPTSDNTQENFTSTIIILGLVTVAFVLGVLIYFKKRR